MSNQLVSMYAQNTTVSLRARARSNSSPQMSSITSPGAKRCLRAASLAEMRGALEKSRATRIGGEVVIDQRHDMTDNALAALTSDLSAWEWPTHNKGCRKSEKNLINAAPKKLRRSKGQIFRTNSGKTQALGRNEDNLVDQESDTRAKQLKSMFKTDDALKQSFNGKVPHYYRIRQDWGKGSSLDMTKLTQTALFNREDHDSPPVTLNDISLHWHYPFGDFPLASWDGSCSPAEVELRLKVTHGRNKTLWTRSRVKLERRTRTVVRDTLRKFGRGLKTAIIGDY